LLPVSSESVSGVPFKDFLLHLFLYGCKTWFLILRDENRLTMIENKVMRKIFEPKEENVTDG
jgi:hypothetical protein